MKALKILLVFISLLNLAAGAAVVDEIVVKVNDSVVTKSEYEARLKSTIEGMKKEYKGPDLEALIKEVPQRLLEQMTDELLLLEKAKQLYNVDELVNFQIENFMKENKIATKEDLAKGLQSEGLSMDQFKKQITQVYVPEFIKSREVRSKISLTTDEISAYYEANKRKLASAEQLSLQEIFFAKPGVSDEEAQRLADEIKKQVDAGKDFGELAAAYSQAHSKSNRGEAGWFSPSDLSTNLATPIFATPVGKVTPLLTTAGGYYIFKVTGRREPKVPTLDESRENIVEVLKEEKFQKAFKEYVEVLKVENYVRINPKYV